MKKRKAHHHHNAASLDNTMTQENKFGLVFGKVPAARDGHSANVDKQGYLYIFGGDRHHMPFNDLYMIKLPE